MSKSQYIQDSLPLRVENERIPSKVPPVDTRPRRRVPWRRLPDASVHGVPEFKHCRTCDTVKPASEFTPSPESRDHLYFRCKACNHASQRARHQQLTPDDKAKILDKYLQRTYGMTLEQRDALLDAQGGVCAICGSLEHRGRGWHVDHDHDTNVVRGILCNGCNTSIGHCKENPAILRAAAMYLEKHGK